MRKTILFISTMILMGIIVGSCQQEEADTVKNSQSFLSIEHPIIFSQLSSYEKQIMAEAFLRLTIVKDNDGTVRFEQKTAEEVNVSDEIFDFFVKTLENTNKKYLELVSCKTRTGVWDNDSTASDNEQEKGVDCVVRSIFNILTQDFKLTNYTYNMVLAELTQKGYYIPGQGTIRACIGDALSCFFNTQLVDPTQYKYADPSTNHYFLVQKTDLGNNHYAYHSETPIIAGGGGFYCRNDQFCENTDTFNIVSYSEIESLYCLTLR